ncbi:NADP-dependent oxidoreductase [Bordetella sp. N]|uniref:NADP-dependent oxidoreductase n=1 Tax=Bordetella sp. N TaxID=1746199 RepID=UPI00070ED1A9|nr:NADP-dependent oxidoreductase [Bordetella sp. N]ALM85936.1 NADP-dependent oxidoreductase [Bordetella sp. N]
MPTPIQARRIVLAARPQGEPKDSDFRSESFAPGEPAPGQVLLECLYLSLDPYMRGRMSDAKSYAPSVAPGQTIVGEVVARVLASASPAHAVGDLVLAHAGWTTHAVMDAKGLVKIDPATAPIETRLGVLGMPGFTAFAGLREIGRPRAGETVVVAAASGPVGSLVGQLAKRDGARAVGIAGGADKCAYVKNELGFDAVIDHRREDMAQALAAACPDGIDVYFENVGGAVWDAVFPLLNPFARIPVCGLIADYNGTRKDTGDLTVPGLMRGVLTKRLTLRGFINYDLESYREDFLREVGAGLRDGSIYHREDISEGLDSAPQAFMGMLKGRNFGKVLVRLAG